MNFDSPHLLFFLIVPILAAIGTTRQRNARVASPVSPTALRPRMALVWLLKLPTLLPAALLAVFIVLLAGPIRSEQSAARVPKSLTNIEFCINVSNSMLATRFGKHCRYCAAASSMEDFARGREGDAFGLTLCGSIPIIWVPLSDDLSATTQAAQLCYPDHMPDSINQFADTVAAIRMCVEQLSRRGKGSGGRLLILLTDGEDKGIMRHADELSAQLSREGITLYVLLFQNRNSAPTLASLAARTDGGQMFDCSSSQELAEAFRKIDNMQKIEYEVGTPQTSPDTMPWIAAGGVLSFTYLLSLYGLRFTPW